MKPVTQSQSLRHAPLVFPVVIREEINIVWGEFNPYHLFLFISFVKVLLHLLFHRSLVWQHYLISFDLLLHLNVLVHSLLRCRTLAVLFC